MTDGKDTPAGTHREEPTKGTHPPLVRGGRSGKPSKSGRKDDLRPDGGELQDDGEEPEADGVEGSGDGAESDGDEDGASTEGATSASSDPATNGQAEATEEAVESLGVEFVLDHVDAAVFTLDADGEVVSWNDRAESLTGVSSAEAKAVETVSQAFYHDGRRSKTLADKVLEAPETCDTEFGVERVDDVGYTLYSDRSQMTDGDGHERHIEFSAAPLYEDEELVGVVEIVKDRTDDVRRQEQLQSLIDEVQTTMEAIGEGDLEARAEFEGSGMLEDEYHEFVDTVNEMGMGLERIFEDLASQTQELSETASSLTESSADVDAVATEQVEEITAVATEVADMSATVEEIAATADNVEETSSEAADVAEEGYGVAEDAVDEMKDVADAAEDVAHDVDELQRRVEEIDEIVEVINDIADQTNLLALNASIEAARAGEAGEGFAVVADEVKNLAEESQQQAGQIEQTVEAIQDDTAETVASLSEMNDNVDSGIDQVEGAMLNFENILDLVKETETGITEVANATDDQAASTEEMATMVNEAVGKADAISKEAAEIVEIAERQESGVEETDELLRTFAGDALDGEVKVADGGTDQ